MTLLPLISGLDMISQLSRISSGFRANRRCLPFFPLHTRLFAAFRPPYSALSASKVHFREKISPPSVKGALPLQGKVEICGVNTAKLPVLKNEETQALLRRARSGDQSAREELISGNLRLVLSVIQKFSGRGENVDDLFQVGCIGLIKAIDNFDPAQNVRFSTYGVPRGPPWRKNLRVIKVTRKQALMLIIQTFEGTSENSPELCKAFSILREMANGTPGKIWSEESIRAAIDRFVAEHGRPPKVKELDTIPYLPPHTVIKNMFKMTAGCWLDENFPDYKASTRSKCSSMNSKELLDMFAAEFNRIQPHNSLDYNRHRAESTPTWSYIAKRSGVRTWTELKALSGVQLLEIRTVYRVSSHIPRLTEAERFCISNSNHLMEAGSLL